MGAIGGEGGDGVVIAHEELVLFADDCVEVGGEDIAETASDDHHVVFLEVGGSGLALLSETQAVGVPGQEGLPSNLADGEH